MPAGREICWEDNAKGPRFMSERYIWQTSQLEELSVCREHGKERKQRCPTVPSQGGWEKGSVLNSNSDHRRRDSSQGKIMNCLKTVSLTK